MTRTPTPVWSLDLSIPGRAFVTKWSPDGKREKDVVLHYVSEISDEVLISDAKAVLELLKQREQ